MGTHRYIWQHEDWPHWHFDLSLLIAPMNRANRLMGELAGRLHDCGFDLADLVTLDALSADVIKTSAIEGEDLPPHSVRSSLARHLGVPLDQPAPMDRQVEGVVDLILLSPE